MSCIPTRFTSMISHANATIASRKAGKSWVSLVQSALAYRLSILEIAPAKFAAKSLCSDGNTLTQNTPLALNMSIGGDSVHRSTDAGHGITKFSFGNQVHRVGVCVRGASHVLLVQPFSS